ncbi:YceI family protein [Rhodanobacter sp. DHG33]|uniref:YceI family protein n=1 Tax=Rhodanobacter sp. DHG33 TaxID=2775921 RepID=UPI00177BDDA6|nr:YceI family protein [Rhodanobacter sp. DHG33]MBD8897721.1 YceI family protein [Rhodanobacter sp. DHG33]
MKTIHRFAAGALLAFALPCAAFATDYAVQPASTLGFTGSFQGTSFDGGFKQWKAAISYDPAQLAQSKFDVNVTMASVAVSDKDQQGALPGKDFFNVAQYPDAHFVTTGFRSVGGKVVADGQLTLRGVTKPVSLVVDFKPQGKNATLDVSGSLKRLDFSVGGGEYADTSVIGADVKVHAHLVLVAK